MSWEAIKSAQELKRGDVLKSPQGNIYKVNSNVDVPFIFDVENLDIEFLNDFTGWLIRVKPTHATKDAQ